MVYVCGDDWMATNFVNNPCLSWRKEAGWIQRGWIPNAFVKVVVRVMVIRFMNRPRVVATIVSTRVSSQQNELDIIRHDCMSIGPPGDDDGGPYSLPHFLFSVC